MKTQPMHALLQRRLSLAGAMLLLLTWCTYSTIPSAHVPVRASSLAQPEPQQRASSEVRRTVAQVDFLGEVVFPGTTMVEGTTVGGLSGMIYDAENAVYYALSDSPGGDTGDPRFYTIAIDVSDGSLDTGDIAFQDVTTLRNADGEPFAQGTIDPEGFTLTMSRTLLISSEGFRNADPPVDPFIREFTLSGQQTSTLTIPDRYLITDTMGIRNNLAFESLTLSPDQRYLYTATEGAILQDGPAATPDNGSLSRVLKYDMQTRQPVAEVVYVNEPVAEPPDPEDAFTVNGLVDLLATDNNGTFLALERSFSVGKGNTVTLYEGLSQGALDVSSRDTLTMTMNVTTTFEIDPPILKKRLVSFSDLISTTGNLEGLALGPTLSDGRQLLMVVSDNNFGFDLPTGTQFLALAITWETTPIATPTVETPRFIDEADAELSGDSDDPAIWVHPTDPAQSLVLATVKDGGMVVFDLEGEILQRIAPETFGSIRYNNVDLIYNFPLGGETVDLAVASDRANDTLAMFTIDPATRQLTNVTAPDILATIFGVDDGEATAYGLATYTSIETGKFYAFVTQSDGNLVAQLELTDNGSGRVQAEVVRMLVLPVPTGDPSDSQSEGLVVDREMGTLYVGMEEEVGVLKGTAEPVTTTTSITVTDALTVTQPIDNDILQPDIEGLTIYYGADGAGYLLVSSQGNSSYAVYERGGDNAYIGSFAIGDNDGIDQANESDGADIINVPLGDAFPTGLLVVQDGANDPQYVAVDEEEVENRSTNFKYVPWEHVAASFSTPLITDTVSYDPRASTLMTPTTRVYLPYVASN